MNRPDFTAWPAPVVQALRRVGIEAAPSTRADGRLSLRMHGPRIDLHRLADGAVALSAMLARLPTSPAAQESLVLRALGRAPLDGGLWPGLAIAGEELLLQLRVDRAALASFERLLARFACAAVSERQRLRQASDAPPHAPPDARLMAAVAAPMISWRQAHDPNPWR